MYAIEYEDMYDGNEWRMITLPGLEQVVKFIKSRELPYGSYHVFKCEIVGIQHPI